VAAKTGKIKKAAPAKKPAAKATSKKKKAVKNDSESAKPTQDAETPSEPELKDNFMNFI